MNNFEVLHQYNISEQKIFKKGIAAYATWLSVYLIIYNNSYESIGQICKKVFGDGFILDNIILYLILLLFVSCFCLFYIFKKDKKGIGIFVFFILFICISLLNNISLWDYIKNGINSLLLCCITYLSFQYTNLDLLLSKLKQFKWPMIFLFLMTYLLMKNDIYIESSKQVIAYNSAMVGTVFCCELFTKENKKFIFSNLIGYIASLILILAFGSRGAFLGLCVISGMMALVFLKKYKYIIVCIIALFICFIDNFFVLIKKFLVYFSINTRLVDYLSSTNFFTEEGRKVIYNCIDQAIIRNPYTGYGIYGDRIIIKSYTGILTYPHNIIREILCQFGLPFGLVILISIIILIFRFLSNKKISVTVKSVLLILSLRGVACLMVSGSYLDTIEFFAVLSIVFRYAGNNVERECIQCE